MAILSSGHAFVILEGDGTDTYAFSFPYLDEAHIVVEVDGVSEAFTFPSASSVQITSGAVSASSKVEIRRETNRTARLVDFSDGSSLTEDQLDLNADQIFYVSQESIDEVSKSIRIDTATNTVDFQNARGTNLDDPTAATDVMNNQSASTAVTAAQAAQTAAETAKTASETAQAAAETAETNAGTSATAAATSATASASSATASAASASSSSTSEGNASASATAAAASAAASAWNDVNYKTNADSPITIADADNGEIFLIDCSSGPVTVNLPAISGLSLNAEGSGWKVGIKKTDSSTNSITVNRGGTDTIEGDTAKTVSNEDGYITLIADDSQSPDEWAFLNVGPIAQARKIQVVHYDTISGYGSTNTKIPYYTNARENSGDTDLGTVTNSSSTGFSYSADAKVRVNISGSGYHSSQLHFGITKESSELSTNIQSLSTVSKRKAMMGSNGQTVTCSTEVVLEIGEEVRIHTNGVSASPTDRWSVNIVAEEIIE